MVNLKKKETNNIRKDELFIKKTKEQINEGLAEYYWEITSDYLGNDKPCEAICLKCGKDYLFTEARHVKRRVCKCMKDNHTFDSYSIEVLENNWILDTDFITTRKACHATCVLCNTKREFNYAYDIKKAKCICLHNRNWDYLKLGEEEYIKRAKELGFTVKGKYEGMHFPIKLICDICKGETNLPEARYITTIACKDCKKTFCGLCGTEFKYKSLKIRQICYTCAPDKESYSKALRKYKIKLITERYGDSCKICGFKGCFASFNFHHLDPKDKTYKNGNLIGNYAYIEKAFPELDKCLLICANCHNELTLRMHYNKNIDQMDIIKKMIENKRNNI